MWDVQYKIACPGLTHTMTLQEFGSFYPIFIFFYAFYLEITSSLQKSGKNKDSSHTEWSMGMLSEHQAAKVPGLWHRGQPATHCCK